MIRELEKGDFSPFPRCADAIKGGYQPQNEVISLFVESLDGVRRAFEERFNDFEAHSSIFEILANPFRNDLEFNNFLDCEVQLLRNYPSYLIHRSAMQSAGKLSFFQNLPIDLFPGIKTLAMKYFSIFGTTYKCEAAFSRLSLINNEFRSPLTNANIEAFLRVNSSYSPSEDMY